MVKANDTCADIAKEYSISQAQFYAWNPAVGGTLYKSTTLISNTRSLLTTPAMQPIVPTSMSKTRTVSSPPPLSAR